MKIFVSLVLALSITFLIDFYEEDIEIHPFKQKKNSTVVYKPLTDYEFDKYWAALMALETDSYYMDPKNTTKFALPDQYEEYTIKIVRAPYNLRYKHFGKPLRFIDEEFLQKMPFPKAFNIISEYSIILLGIRRSSINEILKRRLGI